MSDPFNWSARTLGPSREERQAAAARRALPRRGATSYAGGMTPRERRRAEQLERQEQRRAQRRAQRQVMDEARERDRARRREHLPAWLRRDAGEVTPEPVAAGGGLLVAGLLILALAPVLLGSERVRRAAPWA